MLCTKAVKYLCLKALNSPKEYDRYHKSTTLPHNNISENRPYVLRLDSDGFDVIMGAHLIVTDRIPWDFAKQEWK